MRSMVAFLEGGDWRKMSVLIVDKYEGYEMLARRLEDNRMGMGTTDGDRPGRLDGLRG